jgi:hypothetical protein
LQPGPTFEVVEADLNGDQKSPDFHGAAEPDHLKMRIRTIDGSR